MRNSALCLATRPGHFGYGQPITWAHNRTTAFFPEEVRLRLHPCSATLSLFKDPAPRRTIPPLHWIDASPLCWRCFPATRSFFFATSASKRPNHGLLHPPLRSHARPDDQALGASIQDDSVCHGSCPPGSDEECALVTDHLFPQLGQEGHSPASAT